MATITGAGAGREVRAGAVLVAVGRRANVVDLELDVAGVAVGPDGIVVDRHARTSNPHVYAGTVMLSFD